MSRRNAVCLAVIVLAPLAASAVASAFSVAVGNLLPALPAMLAAAIANSVAAVMTRVPARCEDAVHFGAIGYALAGTFGYAAITVAVTERL